MDLPNFNPANVIGSLPLDAPLPFEPSDDDLIALDEFEILDDEADDVPGLLLKPSEVIESMERRMFEACVERERQSEGA